MLILDSIIRLTPIDVTSTTLLFLNYYFWILRFDWSLALQSLITWRRCYVITRLIKNSEMRHRVPGRQRSTDVLHRSEKRFAVSGHANFRRPKNTSIIWRQWIRCYSSTCLEQSTISRSLDAVNACSQTSLKNLFVQSFLYSRLFFWGHPTRY